MRLLGKFYLDWKVNSAILIYNQPRTTMDEKAEQFRILKENFSDLVDTAMRITPMLSLGAVKFKPFCSMSRRNWVSKGFSIPSLLFQEVSF